MVNAEVEGRQLPRGEYTVEPWMAQLWADATRNESDEFRYDEAAEAIGEDRQLVPPELGMLVARKGIGQSTPEMLEGLDVDWERGVYHGEQGFEFYQPLLVDETYHVEGRVSDIERKEGSSGEFDVVTIEFEVTDSQGEPAFDTYQKTILMR